VPAVKQAAYPVTYAFRAFDGTKKRLYAPVWSPLSSTVITRCLAISSSPNSTHLQGREAERTARRGVPPQRRKFSLIAAIAKKPFPGERLR
jgi:hypothetical protein